MSPLGDDFFQSPPPRASVKPLTTSNGENRSFYSSKSPGAAFDVSAIRSKAAVSGAAPKHGHGSARKRVYSSQQGSFLAGADTSNLENDDILVETETLSGTPTSGTSPTGHGEREIRQDWRANLAPGSRRAGLDRITNVR